jgi:hypothetical protein
MSNSSRIETREIADADLESISGGLSVSGTAKDLTIHYTQGPGGVPIVDGSAKSATISVDDIPLGSGAVTG